MTFGLYVTYDKVGEEFSPVFQQKNDNVCKRVVHDLLKKSAISPVDYQIYKVGNYDMEHGVVTGCYKPVCLNCLELFSDEEKKEFNIQPSLFDGEEVEGCVVGSLKEDN